MIERSKIRRRSVVQLIRPALRRASKVCEGGEFDGRLAQRMAHGARADLLAIVELQDPDAHGPRTLRDGLPPTSEPQLDPAIADGLSLILDEDDVFCLREGQIHVLLGSRNDGSGLRRLRLIGRLMSSRGTGSDSGELHPTPATGYVPLSSSRTLEDLLEKARSALASAKSSLEIEPLPYNPRPSEPERRGPRAWASKTWGRAPPLVVLFTQFLVTLLLGLGAPFLIYAALDALGVDITGWVYLGVVAVLVVTATSIWIEGFLSLKTTEPPKEPGAPHPIATVIIPAYLPNEKSTIVETLNAFLRLDYPNLVQVIIAYNSPGPRLPVEDELESIARSAAAVGRFLVEPIRVAGSTSKAQNVNAVIGRVRGTFVGIFDADHHPLPDSLLRAWRWLSNGWDIVQGRCSIRNGHESWVARMVAVEFEQIYAVSHPGRARLHGFGIFGGSNGFWLTSVLHQTRMRVSMLTEDIDSSIRALESGYKIAGDRDLISEELAPTALRPLLNQRLRWAQGWFQVSMQRIIPALRSDKLTIRQKLGLVQLLVWREFFPWYSIQVIPILAYWGWIYGWSHINWAVPLFVVTTIYTASVGPGQVLFAYILSRRTHAKASWFLEYLLVSTLLYAPFKDALSRVAQLKEGMGERTWKVTPRMAAAKADPRLAHAALVAAGAVLLWSGHARAAPRGPEVPSPWSVLIGGEATMIRTARDAARHNRNEEAAALFEKAISAVPRRRGELLPEYADALTYSGRSREAASLYREILASSRKGSDTFPVCSQLALALEWSGQNQAALASYDDLLAQRPEDAGLRLHRARTLAKLGRSSEAVASLDRAPSAAWDAGPLGELGDEVLVDAARDAARAGRHEASSGLFERALRHNRRLRPVVLREYADELVLSKHAALAVPLYKELTGLPPASAPVRTEAGIGLSQALAKLDRPADAYHAYLAALASSWETARSSSADLSLVLHAKAIPSERLVTAARMAMAAEQSADAALLIRKAAVACPRCKDQLLRDYTAQAAGRRDAVAQLQSAVAMSTPGSAVNRIAQRELAAASSATPAAALSAWTAYLKAHPADVDARLQRAQALSDLHRDADALDAYRSAYELDPTKEGARRGLVEKTLTLARQAAQEDRNADAAAGFAAAVSLDPARRHELLREYADQLSFTGRFAEAVPLYREALTAGGSTALDHRRAVAGLSFAYTRMGRPGAAMAGFSALEQAWPDDLDIRWARAVFAAREAARTDSNVLSAQLFATAMTVDPSRRREVLREYADQLHFSDQSDEAVPLYRAVLDEPGLAMSERKLALKGLAEALTWTKQLTEAQKTYDALLQLDSDDVGVAWSRLVLMARQAALTDRNADSADLFFQAVRLAPDRSGVILREYADQLGFMGRPSGAVPIYRKALATKLSAQDRLAAETGLAQATEWAGHLSEAKALYRSLAAAHPENADLQWRSLVVSAREAGQRDQNKEAAALFERALQLAPDRRDLILKEYADKLTFSMRSREAAPLYRELLAKSPNPRGSKTRTLRMDLARALTWSGQYGPAIAEYYGLVRLFPQDTDVRNSLARALQWSGQQAASKAVFQQVLEQDPDNAEGQRGLAQVEDWQGHHRIAQAILTKRLKAEPRDLEARRLLAQSQVWLGRPDKAVKELQVGLAPDPPPADRRGDGDVPPQLQLRQGGSMNSADQIAPSDTGARPSRG